MYRAARKVHSTRVEYLKILYIQVHGEAVELHGS